MLQRTVHPEELSRSELILFCMCLYLFLISDIHEHVLRLHQSCVLCKLVHGAAAHVRCTASCCKNTPPVLGVFQKGRISAAPLDTLPFVALGCMRCFVNGTTANRASLCNLKYVEDGFQTNAPPTL